MTILQSAPRTAVVSGRPRILKAVKSPAPFGHLRRDLHHERLPPVYGVIATSCRKRTYGPGFYLVRSIVSAACLATLSSVRHSVGVSTCGWCQ